MISALGLLVFAEAPAFAQGGRPGDLPAKPPLPAEQPPTPPLQQTAPPAPAPDRLAEALAPVKNGLTPNEAARIAQKTRPSLRVKEAELKQATARVDQALLGFLPRVTVTAGYTRLSEVKNSLGGGGTGASLGSLGAGPVAACNLPENKLIPGAICALQIDPNDPTNPAKYKETPVAAVQTQGFSFPVLLNSYSFTASVAVPISDYLLRISQGYAAASHAESAKRIELEAEGYTVAADAKISYYNWVRTKAAAVVVADAVAQADAHLKDVKRAFEVGLSSKGDVLRLEAQLAAAQQTQADLDALANLSEEALRISLGLPSGKPIGIGISVLEVPTDSTNVALSALQDEAMAKRLEIRALDETEMSLKKTVSLTRAGYLPRVDAYADANYQNPNQRFFPQKDEFRFTWDAGVRLSWTINDTLTAAPAVTEAQARVVQIEAQKEAIRQGLKLEVTSAYTELKRAEANIEAADRGLVAAEEALRVQTELIRAGRATGVSLVDAEAELTRARLRRVDTRISILAAKTRLEHATGRDIQSP